ncbi:MAG: nucleotidyl transferase AbiEii/AbiGii toxin family protein [archaeon]|nr:nucleotidyl transferase AbiEii/AbiGii toxin family protein [archaeon]
MIEKETLNWLSKKLGIPSIILIEKDLYLQALLLQLAEKNYFSENFVFKGGTCLTKAYFGYYRFSEDLDFTWLNTKFFENKSENLVRKMLSSEINKIIELFAAIAKELSLDFKPEKANKHYVQFGGSNRFVTFKFWYKPIDEDRETFIKIQLNFIEKIYHSPKKHLLKAIAKQQTEDMEYLYPKYASMACYAPTFYCYDLKEIAAEKIRALLTRRGFKARDVIDLYYLAKKGATIIAVKKMAFEKTKFMLKYLKYAENLQNKHFEEKFELEKEQNLMIKKPAKDFEAFANKTLKELNKLAEELRQNIKEKA